MLTLVIIIILIALIFDFINGFHDAANSIATVVSTRVLTPRFAVMWAAFFNFIGAFGFETHVAKTMGSGMIQLNAVNEYVILAGLIGAIVWDLITWYFGLPTSSSHALIGAYAGAAVARVGFSAIIAAGWTKTLIFIVLSPIIGGVLGFSMMVIVLWLFRHFTPSSVDKHFGRLQLVSAGLFSLGHGVNDAQKTMGIIAALLFTSGYLPNPQHSFLGGPALSCSDRLWVRCQAAGESLRRWDRKLPSSSLWVDSAPKRRARLRCWAPPLEGYQSARLTPSPEPSWVWEPPSVCHRCAGVWPTPLFGLGC